MPWPLVQSSPSGRRYEAIAGDFANIPTVPQAVADALLAAARKLDEAPLTRQQMEAKGKGGKDVRRSTGEINGQGSVIDAYNQQTTIENSPRSPRLQRHRRPMEAPRRQEPVSLRQ